jgi:hypothetical protein
MRTHADGSQKHDNAGETSKLIHPTKTTKWLNRVVVAALIASALGLFVILRWSFEDTTVLEIHNNPFPARIVPDPTGKTGGIIFLQADYCKDKNVSGTTRISYVSANREVFLPLAPEQLPKGCASKEVPIVIPRDLPQDTYKVRFHVTYDVNPLKNNVTTDFESRSFTVGTQGE